jgi:carnitine 3-dehydrogenase
MGMNLIYHLAGGESGMRHMLEQFGPALKWPWTKLEAPELTGELIDRMVEGTKESADGRSIRELERLRDDYLVSIQQVLRQYDLGAGRTLRLLEERLFDEARSKRLSQDEPNQALKLLDTPVRTEWVDYNKHMSDFRYGQVFGDAMDALFRRVGMDADYRAQGRSYFTVETHIRHLAEARAGDSLYVTMQVLDVDDKRLHVFLRMFRSGDNREVAVAEQMHLHVDTKASKASPAGTEVVAALRKIKDAHAKLPRPRETGRAIGGAR